MPKENIKHVWDYTKPNSILLLANLIQSYYSQKCYKILTKKAYITTIKHLQSFAGLHEEKKKTT
ncbi:hypothetical protein KSP40_PGU011751 [Platanthera guangdongensis]|uniref:Uncharacterized protein n=1 Tax=Platanthera guangdongensis TaxID=2320717 RepID=A0ABR2LIG9_9ASPA